MDLAAATRFLHDHYQDDTLHPDRIRADNERHERILSNPERFPDADLETICLFGDAAAVYLAEIPYS
jgi:hypothetical protein